MDYRERDLAILQIKTHIYSLTATEEEIKFYYDEFLFPIYKEVTIFKLIEAFQDIDPTKVAELNYDEIYQIANKFLKNITSNSLYINYLAVILFTKKADAFKPSNREFLKEKILTINNFPYEKNTNDGYLASEFNIILLRLYNLATDFENNYDIINSLLEKQKEFNTWVLNYFEYKIKGEDI